jgi:hypothetical protein
LLRGSAAPETVVGPFASLRAAERHPREDGYCIAQELTVTKLIDENHLSWLVVRRRAVRTAPTH